MSNGTTAFIRDLVTLLVRLDRGMLEFEEPLPRGVEVGIMDAVVVLGDQALAPLHDALTNSWSSDGGGTYLIDVLGRIGNPASVPILIEHHRNHADFMSGSAAMSALRAIKAEDGCGYMGECLVRCAEGDERAFNTGLEKTIASSALGEWRDPRAIMPLMHATRIHDRGNNMPETAICSLARYPEAHPFLRDLARREPSLQGLIAGVHP